MSGKKAHLHETERKRERERKRDVKKQKGIRGCEEEKSEHPYHGPV